MTDTDTSVNTEQEAETTSGESSDEVDQGFTRRDALVGAASILGVGGLSALTSSGNAESSGSFTAGGGNMADPAAQYRTKLYTGTLDERPSPGVEGRYWAATDAKVLYRDTGSQWVVEGGLGSEDNPLPELHSEKVHTDDINNREQVYGGGDDSDIRDAISNLPSGRDKWGIVDVEGQFDVHDEITVPAYTWLDLTGARLTLQPGAIASGDKMFRYADDAQQTTIFGGILDGNKSAFSGNNNSGIEVRGLTPPNDAEFLEMRNRVLYTQMKDFERSGILARSRRGFYANLTSVNCDAHGFQALSSDQIWLHCLAESSGVNGWRVDGGFQYFFHCIADKSSKRGWRFTSSGIRNTVIGGYSEFTGRAGMWFESGADRNRVSHHWFIDNGQDEAGAEQQAGINNEANRTKIHDNWFYDDDIGSQTTSVWVGSGASRTWIRDNDDYNNPGGITDNGEFTKINGRVKGTYTGDGTQNRRIAVGYRPSLVYVEGSDGTLYEVRDDSLSVINGSAPSGELSIQSDGFEVGDNGADADPNTDQETYTYIAID